MLRKLVLVLALGVVLAGVIGAAQTLVPSTPGAKEGGTLTIGVSQDFKDLDPRISNSAYDSYVIGEIFDDLVALEVGTLKPIPHVAKSWEVLSDSQVRFYLNEGIKFTNGEPLTADDVAFSFNWIADPASGSPNSTELSWMEKAVVVNEYTVDIITKAEYAPYAPGFATESRSIVPHDTVVQMGDAAFNLSPIGSGPYKLLEWKAGDRVVLVRNEDYWLTKPNLEKVIYRPIPELSVMMLELESGGIDIADNTPVQDVIRFRNNLQLGVNILQCPSLSYFYIFFNMENSPSNDIRFRKACYMSVDMDAAVFSIFQNLTGVRAYGCIPPALWANDREYLENTIALEEDDAEAKRLFAELKKDGTIPANYKFTLYCPLDPRRTQLATILATNIKENGLGCEVQPLAWGPLLDLFYGSEADPTRSKVVVGIMGWSGGPDPHDFIYYMFTTENATLGDANNYPFYKNPAVDALIKKADTTLDQAERESLFIQAQRLVYADYPAIPGYHYIETKGVRTRVQGFIIDPLGALNLCDPQHNVWLQ
jgi:peptide/nickel transport system substrate-binding protein